MDTALAPPGKPAKGTVTGTVRLTHQPTSLAWHNSRCFSFQASPIEADHTQQPSHGAHGTNRRIPGVHPASHLTEGPRTAPLSAAQCIAQAHAMAHTSCITTPNAKTSLDVECSAPSTTSGACGVGGRPRGQAQGQRGASASADRQHGRQLMAHAQQYRADSARLRTDGMGMSMRQRKCKQPALALFLCMTAIHRRRSLYGRGSDPTGYFLVGCQA